MKRGSFTACQRWHLFREHAARAARPVKLQLKRHSPLTRCSFGRTVHHAKQRLLGQQCVLCVHFGKHRATVRKSPVVKSNPFAAFVLRLPGAF